MPVQRQRWIRATGRERGAALTGVVGWAAAAGLLRGLAACQYRTLLRWHVDDVPVHNPPGEWVQLWRSSMYTATADLRLRR